MNPYLAELRSRNFSNPTPEALQKLQKAPAPPLFAVFAVPWEQPSQNIGCALDTPIRRTATPAESAELAPLIRRVLADRPDEWDDAIAAALADPEAALTSFRALATDLPASP